ncbi:MAG TPA: AI-2E family transporter [Pseudorhizobium sp.]|nr:AI-2E family transporter [Pseudorhizobium sp.]
MGVERFSFHVLLVLVTIAFGAIIFPFYSAVFWALVFAIIFYPLHAWIERKLNGHSNMAAAVSVLVCLCLVIVPGLIILGSLVQQGNDLYQRIDSGEIDIRRHLTDLQQSLPLFAQDILKSIELNGFQQLQERVSDTLMRGGSFFAGRALSFGQNTVQFVIAFGVMLYLLFFLFRDGRSLSRLVRRSIPLSDNHTGKFTAKFTSVVRATVRGNVIIAIIQGTIGGITFWGLGVQPALLWGVVMSFLSLLPAVGAALVWVPTAVYLILAGFWMKAMILVAVGALGIGLIDNLLRPPLVGKEVKLPDYVVLISTIGGISLMGINGFVIGPLIAALFIAAWGIFTEEQHTPSGEPADLP